MDATKCIIRRVGGLEDMPDLKAGAMPIIRRVGGLEVSQIKHAHKSPIIRRVGGLEAYLPRPREGA